MAQQEKNTRPFLKICGLTRLADVEACLVAGVDFVGFNLCPKSRRFIDATLAANLWRRAHKNHPRASTQPVAVTVNATLGELAGIVDVFPELVALQLHGQESGALIQAAKQANAQRQIWRAYPLKSRHDVGTAAAFARLVDLVVLDTAASAPGATVAGGSGQRFDWEWLVDLPPHVQYGLAGGIRQTNLLAIKFGLKAHQPILIDICSGVELQPGIKDPTAIQATATECRALWL